MCYREEVDKILCIPDSLEEEYSPLLIPGELSFSFLHIKKIIFDTYSVHLLWVTKCYITCNVKGKPRICHIDCSFYSTKRHMIATVNSASVLEVRFFRSINLVQSICSFI